MEWRIPPFLKPHAQLHATPRNEAVQLPPPEGSIEELSHSAGLPPPVESVRGFVSRVSDPSFQSCPSRRKICCRELGLPPQPPVEDVRFGKGPPTRVPLVLMLADPRHASGISRASPLQDSITAEAISGPPSVS